jgi:hypothetical protein
MTGPDAAGTERSGDPAEFGVLERGPGEVALRFVRHLPYDLDEAKAPWNQDDRWRTVHSGYVSRFGADAATIGPPAEWEQRT